MWVQQITDPATAPVLLVSAIAIGALAAALARKEREGTVTTTERQQYLGLFALDCQQLFSLLPVTGAVLRLAVTFTHRQALRAYNAVHLATALQANQLVVNTGECSPVNAFGRLMVLWTMSKNKERGGRRA